VIVYGFEVGALKEVLPYPLVSRVTDEGLNVAPAAENVTAPVEATPLDNINFMVMVEG
jgi:hypothetical protein